MAASHAGGYSGRMRIGVIGTGGMGTALGRGWARAGHEVFFGSRDQAKARQVAADASATARAGDFSEAAEFGEVVLHTVRHVPPAKLLSDTRVLDGKTVIDCNNTEILGLNQPDPLGRPGLHFVPIHVSLAEQLAAAIPRAHVVKAFNTMASSVIELGAERLGPERVSVFIAGNHAPSKAVVARLATDLGFVPVDSGDLEHARLIESVADFIRLQIVGLQQGVLATISMRVLPA